MRSIFKSGVLLLLIALSAAGIAACGDEEKQSSNPVEARLEAQAKERAEVKAQNEKTLKEYKGRKAAKLTRDELEAKESADDFYAILSTDTGGANRTTIDSESFCDLMSAKAQAQTIEYAKISSSIQQEWDCETAVDLLVLRSKRTGGFKGVKGAEVIGVNAEGNRATATVRFGNGPATSIPLVKEDGDWKLAAAPSSSSK